MNILRDLAPLLGQRKDDLLREKVMRLLGERGDESVHGHGRMIYWTYSQSGVEFYFYNALLDGITLYPFGDERGIYGSIEPFRGGVSDSLPATAGKDEFRNLLGSPAKTEKWMDRWLYPEFSFACYNYDKQKEV